MAQGPSVGKLALVFEGDSAPVIHAFNDVERRLQRMPGMIRAASPVRAGAEQDTKRWLQGINQLSYGIEDFMSVIGTTGLSGALRASSNNLSQFFRIMSGTGVGAIAGVAVGLGSAFIPMLLKTGDAAAQAKKQMEEFKDQKKNTLEMAGGIADKQQELAKINNAKTEEQINEEIKKRRDLLLRNTIQQGLFNAQLEHEQRKIGELKKKYDALDPKPQLRVYSEEGPLGGSGKAANRTARIQYARDLAAWEARRKGYAGDGGSPLGRLLEYLTPDTEKRLANGVPGFGGMQIFRGRGISQGELVAQALAQQEKIANAKRNADNNERERGRIEREIKQAENRLDVINKEQHDKQLKEFLPGAGAEGAEHFMKQQVNKFFADTIGAPARQMLNSWLQRGQVAKDQREFEQRFGRFQGESIVDENERKLEMLRLGLEEDRRQIESDPSLSPEMRARGLAAANAATSRQAGELLKDSLLDLRKDGRGRAASGGADFTDRNTVEGARNLAESFLRASSQKTADQEFQAKQTQLLTKLLPVIEKLNKLIENPNNHVKVQALNLQGN